jgi:hypothetical protein
VAGLGGARCGRVRAHHALPLRALARLRLLLLAAAAAAAARVVLELARGGARAEVPLGAEGGFVVPPGPRGTARGRVEVLKSLHLRGGRQPRGRGRCKGEGGGQGAQHYESKEGLTW